MQVSNFKMDVKNIYVHCTRMNSHTKTFGKLLVLLLFVLMFACFVYISVLTFFLSQ